MKKPTLWGFTIFLLLLSQHGFSQEILIDVLKDEMAIQQKELDRQEIPVYQIAYRVYDINNYSIRSSFGALVSNDNLRNRTLTPTFRLGDYSLDNYLYNSYNFASTVLPAKDDETLLRLAIWECGENCISRQKDNYQSAKTQQGTLVKSEDSAPAYSAAPVVQYYEKRLPKETTEIDTKIWEEKTKKISAIFKQYPTILENTVSLQYQVCRYYYLNSEGSVIAHNRTYSHLLVNAATKASDGMYLPLSLSYFAFLPKDLPDTDSIVKDVHLLAKQIEALRSAPVVAPYTGPALLSEKSAGVFFHEIFGHRIEGQRLKNEGDAQTFKKMVGQRLLPEDMQVYDDPNQKTSGSQELNGYYLYDDEGVKSERVNIISDGILKNFLMTRVPIDGFGQSNGHARATSGYHPVSRQGNLFIETKAPKSDAELRKMLIEEAKAQEKEYGYLFSEVSGGFTNTDRYSANSFNVLPTLVYRIYTDGRPDELVRGVDLIGTPLSMFSNILCAGDKTGIFTGYCGAESGQIPVSAISPSILVKKIETQRKSKSLELPPILQYPEVTQP